MLNVDVMFINGIPFLVTHSRRIGLVTTEYLPGQSAKHIANHLVTVINIYTKGGFKVCSLLMDNELNKIKDLLPQYNINTMAANEHVGEVKRRIQIIKERAHGILATLPFKMLQKVMIIHLVHFVTMWLNAWPIKTGISSTISTRELLTGMKLTT